MESDTVAITLRVMSADTCEAETVTVTITQGCPAALGFHHMECESYLGMERMIGAFSAKDASPSLPLIR